ncbi:TetR/AcrR family transcriptional regulator [Phytohabitans suffuscus]|uniref:TetR family transcriptional regulator n=1 Tax=Phytohabitans suffuscus TaxID=624315 RepID=A0A6F8YA55_9ACTN|nr:TetR/AcrR family transcriptional regulator [Phytohabitans suffuscus]BCB82985.1 TetR family transcriptional regulator [Phytohabitans suffuscus]
MGTRIQPGPRERLLTAAQRLSYEQGVNVGVDALLSAANVARRSLYEHFGGKDGLIAEVLRRAAAEDLDRYRSAIAAAGDDPRQRLLAVFDMLDEIVTTPGFRGCRYLGADLALAEPAHPAHAVTQQYRQSLHDLLAHEVQRLRLPRPGHVTDQLMLLIEGTLATGAARPTSRPARDARELAQHILS